MNVRSWAVLIAFAFNRFGFSHSARCSYCGFSPSSATFTYGLAIVVILARHPGFYPCWLRRQSCIFLFCYYLILSYITIELSYCWWNVLEILTFYNIPVWLETTGCCCFPFDRDPCSWYLSFLDNPAAVSTLSTCFSVFFLICAIHCSKAGNINLLFCDNGICRFLSDIAKRCRVCDRHVDDVSCDESDQEFVNQMNRMCCNRYPHCLRSCTR